MFDLTTSGINLKTITPKEYAAVIADLNYNFLQIINSPGFKGRQGLTVEGPPGIGIRGSKLVFVKLSTFKTLYNVTSADTIDLAFINTMFADDSVKLFSALDIPGDSELLLGDILVLPNGQIIELGAVTLPDESVVIQFIDSGITFAQVTSLTEDKVRSIFNDLFQDGNQTEAAFRHFKAVPKNNTDKSPALNQNANTDSVIDILTSGSGPGAELPNHLFVGVTEQKATSLTQLCLIAGSPTRYHELVQETQRIHTNNYAPGLDDFAASVVLQNSYKNGILFGHRNSESIRDFGRLYRSINSTVLTSSYSPLQSEFSEINLSNTEVMLRGAKATINSSEFEILSTILKSPFVSYSASTLKLAEKLNSTLEIFASNGVFLKNIKDASVLSTDVNGKIVKAYSILNAMPTTATSTQLLSAYAIQQYIAGITGALEDINGNLDDLNNQDTSGFHKQRSWITSTTNMNTITGHGNSLIKSGTSISNFAPGITSAVADMHVNNFVMSNGSESRLMQEVTMSGGVNGALMNGIKWFRIATKSGTGQWAFSNWSKVVTTADTPEPSGPITVTGAFGNNLKIGHANSPASSTNNNLNTELVKNITLDAFGHIRSIESKDASSIFMKTDSPVKDLPWSITDKTTLKNVLIKIIERNKPRIIITGSMDVAGGTGNGIWYNIPFTSWPALQGGHTFKDHTVKYRQTIASSGRAYLDIETKYTGPIIGDNWQFPLACLVAIVPINTGTQGLPIYAPTQLSDVVTGSMSGSSTQRFYLTEHSGGVQNMKFKLTYLHRDAFIQSDDDLTLIS